MKFKRYMSSIIIIIIIFGMGTYLKAKDLIEKGNYELEQGTSLNILSGDNIVGSKGEDTENFQSIQPTAMGETITATFPDSNLAQAVADIIGNGATVNTVLTQTHITSITKLDISGKNVQSLEGIGNLTSLVELKAQNNKITSIPDELGNNLINLELLYFGSNQVTTIPDSFKNLIKLRNFQIESNNLITISDSFSSLPSLTNLTISNNPLTTLPDNISELQNLTNLYLYGNKLTSLPENFGNFPKLIFLYLGNNKITSLPDSIGNLSTMVTLDMPRNKLINLPDSFVKLSKLTNLNLGENEIMNLPNGFNSTNLPKLNIGNTAMFTSNLLPDNYADELSIRFSKSVSLSTQRYITLKIGLNPYQIKVGDDWTKFETTNAFDMVQLNDGSTLSPIHKINKENIVDINNNTANITEYIENSVIKKSGKLYTKFNLTPTTGMFTKQNDKLTTEKLEINLQGFVHIPDINLRKTINKKLTGIENTTPEYFSNIDLEKLSELSYIQTNATSETNKISDLTGLEYAKNLKKINFPYNNISNISKLGGLTELTDVNLSYNKLTDISELSNLTKLEILDLSGNTLSSIGPIKEKVNLKSLKLNSTGTSDITELFELTNLINLELSNNGIYEIGYLFNITKLEQLVLRDNNISNIYVLDSLQNINYLDISNNKIGNNLNDLTGSAKLKNLTIDNNQVEDISGIKNFPNITYLSVNNNNISDITNINKLTSLIYFSGKNNKIEKIEAFSNNNNLVALYISNNKILDISPLNGIFSNINYFDAKGQQIDLGEQGINSGELIIENPTLTVGGSGKKVPITFISDGGSYNISTGEIKWTTLSNNQMASFSFKDGIGFEGTVNFKAKSNIHVPDPNLRKAINKKLRGTASDMPEYFTQEEMESIKAIDYFGTGNDSDKISSLEGLEYAVNLESIYFYEQNISDLDPLKNLKKITGLSLQYSKIENLKPLENLTTLTELYLDGNKIKDINYLEDLIELETLSLAENQIDNINGLRNMNKLKNLYLSVNQISDITPLKNNTEIMYLFLEINQISDITTIGGLTKLENVGLDNNNISDISPVKTILNLKGLWLSNNIISDISPIKILTNLEGLGISDNNITNIIDLETLDKLNYLEASNNNIVDISSISNMSNLKYLYVDGNQITDISPLSTTINNLDDYSFLDQNVDIGTHKINGNRITIDNPTVSIGKVPDITIYDGGIYDSTLNTISWSGLSPIEFKSFSYEDISKNFSGTINLKIEQVKIKDPVDPDQDRDPSKIDPNWNPDLEHELELAINYIEPIDFGAVGIESRDMEIEAETKVPYIQLTDLRNISGGWKLEVSGSELKNSQNNATIEGVKIELKNGEVKSSPKGNVQSPSIFNDISIILDNTSVSTIMNAESGKGKGTWLGVWEEDSTGKNQKVIMKIPSGKARVGKYETTLNWTLIDTP